jgi:thiamine biosynthesis protein ThiS
MAKQSIRIEVNGSERDVPAGHTIEDLLDTLGVDRRLVVVELNREIVRRTEIADIKLQDGDRLELVHFVGGG